MTIPFCKAKCYPEINTPKEYPRTPYKKARKLRNKGWWRLETFCSICTEILTQLSVMFFIASRKAEATAPIFAWLHASNTSAAEPQSTNVVMTRPILCTFVIWHTESTKTTVLQSTAYRYTPQAKLTFSGPIYYCLHTLNFKFEKLQKKTHQLGYRFLALLGCQMVQVPFLHNYISI